MLFALIINQFDFRLLEIEFHLKCVHSYTINKIFNIQMDIYDCHGQLHEYIYELAYEEALQTFSHSIIDIKNFQSERFQMQLILSSPHQI